MDQLLRAPTVRVEKLDDHVEELHLLFGRDDVLEFEEILDKHLSTKHCLLHHIVYKIFIPWIGSFDYLTKNDMRILYHILKRKQYNLLALMIRIMQEAKIESQACIALTSP